MSAFVDEIDYEFEFRKTREREHDLAIELEQVMAGHFKAKHTSLVSVYTGNDQVYVTMPNGTQYRITVEEVLSEQ